ncbi:Cytochrome subunit of sulfide dehydrogenase [Pandoraea iniqua]|uniref:c-type cytochrome n=1 Tax=Pandoraea iniqua TaxID=2508288 RepID=UPI001240773B|nr:cytochrome c [Pandoraea iniqua]VVE54280.1 Cytochrome subunit of sulfide dehydrogenase [Pandoraea iniqua]
MPALFILGSLAIGMTAPVAAAAPASAPSVAANPQPDWQARDWAMACMSCHNAAAPATAGKTALSKLEGRPATELVAALQALRNAKGDGARPATLMPQLLKGYRDDELQRIAAYFAAQPIAQPLSPSQSQPPARSHTAPVSPAPEAARTHQ